MDFVNTLAIDRPVSEVFAFVSDPENLARWNYYVMSCTKLEAGPLQIGSTYRMVRKSDTRVLAVTELEQDRSLVVQFQSPSPPLKMSFTVEPTATGTRLSDERELSGILGFVGGFAGAPIQKAARQNLEKLKELLEVGRTELQDGRVERYLSTGTKPSGNAGPVNQ